jgi:putrescine transport system substrate-binding protein
LVAICALVAGSAAAAEEKILNLYNWSDYIAKDTITNFEKRTGIDVTYDVFDSNEVLEAKLLTGSTGYDIVVPSAPFLERQIKAGVFAKLDRSKLSNFGNLDEEILERLEKHDPGNAYSIPYLWGTTGVGYDAKKITKLMPDAPVGSWDMIFKPEIAARFAGCGVTILDAPTEVFSSVMGYLGRDPNSEDRADLQAFEDLMLSIRPHIKYFHSSQYINDLASGEVCLVLGWSGDIFQARDRANEVGSGVEVAYFIPKEGAVMWFDQLAVPSDAPHVENAHLFLDYLMEPQVTADLTNAVRFASANKAALPLVKDEIKNDPAIYPPPEVKAKLFTDLAESARFTRLLTRSWTRIKTGK